MEILEKILPKWPISKKIKDQNSIYQIKIDKVEILWSNQPTSNIRKKRIFLIHILKKSFCCFSQIDYRVSAKSEIIGDFAMSSCWSIVHCCKFTLYWQRRNEQHIQSCSVWNLKFPGPELMQQCNLGFLSLLDANRKIYGPWKRNRAFLLDIQQEQYNPRCNV